MPRVAMETSDAVHYASADGGRVAFSGNSDVQRFTGPGPHVVAVLENPQGSGIDMYPTLGEFGNLGAAVRWRRYGGSKLTQRGTPEPIRNRGGGTAESKVGLYVPGQMTVTLSAKPGKQALIAPGMPYIVPIDNVMRPGACTAWTVEAYGLGAKDPFEAALYLEWHELPAAA